MDGIEHRQDVIRFLSHSLLSPLCLAINVLATIDGKETYFPAADCINTIRILHISIIRFIRCHTTMYNSRPHPLLQQVPLTVSPFVALPTAPTLPYNYQPMPSTLPPSILNPPPSSTAATADANSSTAGTPRPSTPKPRYVVSNSGHAAHPQDIIASCREMQSHLDKMRSDAERELAELKESIRQIELAEKRRIAPGWLDSDVRVLEPERKHTGDGDKGSGSGSGESSVEPPVGVSEMATDEGAELDRVFGTLKM